MPRQMRLLFATIVAHNHPTDVLSLWENHKSALTEDFRRTFPQPQATQHALAHINDILKQHGLSCRSLGLPLETLQDGQIQNDLLHEANQFDNPDVQMNEEQEHVINTILQCQQTISQGMNPPTTAFFIDGPGGTGKTTMYNRLIATFHKKNLKVSATAYTGIAATLLHKGQTIHSFYKLPVPIDERSTCNVPPDTQQAQKVRDTDLFIIDEASMVPKHALDAINMMLQDVMDNDKLFGGKIVLLGGDFRQVLPVIPRVAPAVLMENTIKKSNTFQEFHNFKLTTNMRADESEKQFAKWLLEVGEGTYDAGTDALPGDSIVLPSSVITKDIVKDMYDDNDNNNVEKEAILTPKNDATFIINQQILQKLPENTAVYYSTDTITTDDPSDALSYPTEFVNSMTPSGLPLHKLQLKQGAIVMLLRNLDINDGLCNGTRLRICNLYNNVIDAQVLITGKRVFIPRIKLTPSDTTMPFNLHRVQFPIRLAYCMTINKAQGQTFSRVGIYLPYPVFTHGQLYVALSRAKSLNSIRVMMDNTSGQGKKHSKYYTKNIVYREVLG
ncbi:ATP-dependent DNA helicase PIF1-like [Strongylocentrotus purpuratus]|uniref:ATP-dependent DNA helicase n=1 Tax=Strongylocentrotus purpuratus TaxID=7668 RepID=A0A7M7HPA1_STRPU|nr:ATP-dependent DNA helicase PIF1-like [Strongylocentrotus purpuratus]